MNVKLTDISQSHNDSDIKIKVVYSDPVHAKPSNVIDEPAPVLNIDFTKYLADAKTLARQQKEIEKWKLTTEFRPQQPTGKELVPLPPGECWYNTKSSKNSTSEHRVVNYTQWKNKKKRITKLLHRLSWQFHRGYSSIPYKINGVRAIVRHLCHNAWCFNPDHLELGTDGNNRQDDKNAGKRVGGGTCKITEETAILIKHSKYPRGHPDYLTIDERVAKFKHLGATRSIIAGIDNCTTWAHIPDREGNVTLGNLERRKEKDKMCKSKALEYHWTDEDWEEVRQYLINRSEESTKLSYNGIPCRLWKARVQENTYPFASVHHVTYQAHILAAVIGNNCQKPEAGLDACHLCHHPTCVEPKHLVFGTRKENMRQSMVEGRKAKKLTDEQVTDILLTFYRGEMYQWELAKKYDVEQTMISHIVTRQQWTHVTNDEIERLYVEFNASNKKGKRQKTEPKVEDEEVPEKQSNIPGFGTIEKPRTKPKFSILLKNINKAKLEEAVATHTRSHSTMKTLGLNTAQSNRINFKKHLKTLQIDYSHWGPYEPDDEDRLK